MFKRLLSSCIVLSFIVTSVIGPDLAFAQLALPAPGSMVVPTAAFEPLMVRGLKVHPDNPLLFDFIVDAGQSGFKADDAAFKTESEKLIKYFLAALTVPEKDLWVNLSPYEKDRVITAELGGTALGRDMLAQDYILKQLTASMIYPENDLGKAFWQKIYKKAREQFGTSDIPVDTFNKVWVTADKARVFERNNSAYVVGAHLKVMLESDMAAQNSASAAGINAVEETHAQALAKQVIREIVIPAIEQEVNEGRHFAPLRQMFHAMVLAAWYKTSLKDALLNQVYSNQLKTDGVLSGDPKAKEKIYAQYLEAYTKGVFDYIKEDADALQSNPVPRRYFSGGVDASMLSKGIDHVQEVAPQERAVIAKSDLAMMSVLVKKIKNIFGIDKKFQARRESMIKELRNLDGDILHRTQQMSEADQDDKTSLELDRLALTGAQNRKIEVLFKLAAVHHYFGEYADEAKRLFEALALAQNKIYTRFLAQRIRQRLNEIRWASMDVKTFQQFVQAGEITENVLWTIHVTPQMAATLNIQDGVIRWVVAGQITNNTLSFKADDQEETLPLSSIVSIKADSAMSSQMESARQRIQARLDAIRSIVKSSNYPAYGENNQDKVFVRGLVEDLHQALQAEEWQKEVGLIVASGEFRKVSQLTIVPSSPWTRDRNQDIADDWRRSFRGIAAEVQGVKNLMANQRKKSGSLISLHDQENIGLVKEQIESLIVMGRSILNKMGKDDEGIKRSYHQAISRKLDALAGALEHNSWAALKGLVGKPELLILNKEINSLASRQKKQDALPRQLIQVFGHIHTKVFSVDAAQKIGIPDPQWLTLSRTEGMHALTRYVLSRGSVLGNDFSLLCFHGDDGKVFAELQDQDEERVTSKMYAPEAWAKVVEAGEPWRLIIEDMRKDRDASPQRPDSLMLSVMVGQVRIARSEVARVINAIWDKLQTGQLPDFKDRLDRDNIARVAGIRLVLESMANNIKGIRVVIEDDYDVSGAAPVARRHVAVKLSRFDAFWNLFDGDVKRAAIRHMKMWLQFQCLPVARDLPELESQLRPLDFGRDKAMANDKARADYGGIDLNAGNMSLDVSRDGAGVAMRFDPAMVAAFRKGDFSGVEGVILSIVPVQSPLSLLGLSLAQ